MHWYYAWFDLLPIVTKASIMALSKIISAWTTLLACFNLRTCEMQVNYGDIITWKRHWLYWPSVRWLHCQQWVTSQRVSNVSLVPGPNSPVLRELIHHHLYVTVMVQEMGLYEQFCYLIAIQIWHKQRVLMHGHQGWNVRHSLCHIYMRYVYIYELFIAFVFLLFVHYCNLMVCVVHWVGKWRSRGSTGMFGNLMAIYHIMLQFIQNHYKSTFS